MQNLETENSPKSGRGGTWENRSGSTKTRKNSSGRPQNKKAPKLAAAIHFTGIVPGGWRRSGQNAGAGYERRDWLPVNELGGATRHPAHLTEEQVAQRVRQQGALGGPHRAQSTRYRNSRTEVETLLRQRMRGLRSVSFQLPCEEDVLPSAFEDKPLCVPWQLAELLQLSVEEVCADFDAMLRHDCCDGGAAGDILAPRIDERRASEQLLAQEAERRSHRLLFPERNALRSASRTSHSLA